MKKLFITLGVIFLTIIFGVIAFFVVSIYRYDGLDEISEKYTLEITEEILKHGNGNLLYENSHESLKQGFSKSDSINLISKIQTTLGQLKEIGEPEGQAVIQHNVGDKTAIGAEYIIPLVYENGNANLDIKLTQEDGEWEISNFQISIGKL